jgi:hypothetical protein
MDVETTADRPVGIDVSKARVDVHVRPDGTAFGCATDPEGLGGLVARLQACPRGARNAFRRGVHAAPHASPCRRFAPQRLCIAG